MNKRGLSDVVVTVLIILIVIVAIGIISAIVLPLLRDSGKQVGTEKFTTNVEIVPKFTAGSGECVLEFDINRPAGNGNITALRFVLTNTTGGTKTVDYPNAPTTPPFTFGQLEVKHIVLNCTPLNNVASVSVAPIFSNGVGLISDTRPVPASVCGNGVVELGEQCDGQASSCSVLLNPPHSCIINGNLVQYQNARGRYTSCYPQGHAQQCRGASACVQNFACNDGVDNDCDGKIDYPNDEGCTSLTDNDETGVDFSVSISSPRPSSEIVYPAVGSAPYNVDLTLGIIPNQGTQVTAQTCYYEWYKVGDNSVNSAGNVSIPSCNNQAQVGPVNLGLPSSGDYNLIVHVYDASLDRMSTNVVFSLVTGNINIIDPDPPSVIVYTSNLIPLRFQTSFSSISSCSFTLNGGSTNIINNCQPLTNTNFNVNTEGAYDLVLTVTSGVQTLQRSVRFLYDTLPGDISAPFNCVDFTDINLVLSSFGCTSNCGAADIDFDGDVDIVDTRIVIDNYGTGSSCPTQQG